MHVPLAFTPRTTVCGRAQRSTLASQHERGVRAMRRLWLVSFIRRVLVQFWVAVVFPSVRGGTARSEPDCCRAVSIDTSSTVSGLLCCCLCTCVE